MKLHELKPTPGSRKERKRVGRGPGSGHGTTATRGSKGQKARAGGTFKPGFEGGMRALIKRLPHKRGFTNPFRVEYEWVNVGNLAQFGEGAEVDIAVLKKSGLVRTNKPVKILAEGELSIPLTVTAHRFSASARSKIEAAGGKIVELTPRPVANVTSDVGE
jgi:large subunit ribosomal protein L15